MQMSELVEAISKQTEWSKQTIAEILKIEHDLILKTVKTGEPVVLTNFGAFKQVVLKRKNLFGRNLVPKKAIRFRVSRRSR